MAERKRGLGRGLGALIPSAPTEDRKAADDRPESAASSAGPTAPASAPGGSASSSSSTGSEKPLSGKTEKAAPPAEGKPAKKKGKSEPEAATGEGKSTAATPKGQASTRSGEASSDEASTDEATTNATKDETGDVSRGTSGRRRSVSAAARQSAMKSRLDMGVALQNRGGSNRPSDMFFTPTPASAESAESPESADSADEAVEPQEKAAPETVAGSKTSATADVGSDVSRGTTPTSPEAESQESELASVPGATFADVPVASIHPNRKQPRQVFDEDELAELAYSIGELGVLQPIVVRPSRESDGPAYELVMGERRWRASQRAGLDTVPAIVRDTADDDLLRDALLENLHRSQLNPLEEAAAYQQLLEEFGATQEELSRRIGRSRPQISNTLRLMRLPPLVQRRVAAGVLSAGHARALLALEDPAEMERLAQRIVAEGMSVRAAEEAAALSKRGKPGRRAASKAQERHRERLDYIAEAFSDKLDTSVKINLGARKGRMTIEFASVEDLNRIITVLDPQRQDPADEA